MSIRAEVTIYPERVLGEVDRRIYGQYIENVEPDDRVIYGGVCDDDGNLNQPVIEALRTMGVPMLRWGGNYNDVYRWTDGIGPRESRPTRPNYFWGGDESHRFGTDEFLALCEALSTQPFININMGSGDLLEALGWLEYCNYAGDTAYTRQRRQNGRDEPWNVPVWGIGNEAWGSWEACFATPHEYVTLYNKFSEYMRRLDRTIELVAVGHTDRAWNETVLRGMRRQAEYLSIHLYGHSHLDREANYEQLVALPVSFEAELRQVIDDLHAHASAPIGLAIDEWNVRHWRGGKLNRKSPRKLQDALFVAGAFHAMQRCAPYVKTANYVTMVNGNAPIRWWDGELTLTPLYHIFKLFQELTYEQALDVNTSSPSYSAEMFDFLSTPHHRSDEDSTLTAAYVDAAASREQASGRLCVSLINRHAQETCVTEIRVPGMLTDAAPVVTLLHGPQVDEGNAEVTQSGVPVTQLSGDGADSGADGVWSVELPPHSVVWVNFG